MGIIELLILILVVAWALGYFGHGRVYARGPATAGDSTFDPTLVHTLLVIVVVLVILRLLHLV